MLVSYTYIFSYDVRIKPRSFKGTPGKYPTTKLHPSFLFLHVCTGMCVCVCRGVEATHCMSFSMKLTNLARLPSQ